MPVPLYTGPDLSVANGVTTVFPYSFRILDEEDVLVVVDGTEKTLNTDYTVDGVDVSAGGNVTFTTPPVNGAIVLRERDADYKRIDDFQRLGAFNEDQVDDELDLLHMLAQQLDRTVGRSFKAPHSVIVEQALSEAQWAARAGMALGFDQSGNLGLLTLANLSGSVVSAFINTLLDDADAPTARTTLAAGLTAGRLAIIGVGPQMTAVSTFAFIDDAIQRALFVSGSGQFGNNITLINTHASGDAMISAAVNGTGDPMFCLDTNGGSDWYLAIDNSDSDALVFGLGTAPGTTTKVRIDTAGAIKVCADVATPAGGSANARLIFGTAAGFGIYIGSGVPTVSAGQGSLYLRSNGSSTTTRAYINTDGGTTWTAITTVA